jgi:hypothetical protein
MQAQKHGFNNGYLSGQSFHILYTALSNSPFISETLVNYKRLVIEKPI